MIEKALSAITLALVLAGGLTGVIAVGPNATMDPPQPDPWYCTAFPILCPKIPPSNPAPPVEPEPEPLPDPWH